MHLTRKLLSLVASSVLLWNTASFAVDDAELRKQGEYVFRLAGCMGCHTDTKNKGALLAGGLSFDTPFGKFYSPNITPDPVHGIGKWTEADFIKALREGVSPDGKQYYPVFPYTAYSQMQLGDMKALWAYLRTIPAVAQPTKEHQLSWYVFRFSNRGWKMLYFTSKEWENVAGKSAAWNRGAYIANALAHCGECHTPRNMFGALKKSQHYAGNLAGPEGAKVPNITRDVETGIGGWKKDELLAFFSEGATPDGDYTGGLMAEVVDNSLKYLSKEDAEALVSYLAEVPAISNVIKSKEKKRRSD